MTEIPTGRSAKSLYAQNLVNKAKDESVSFEEKDEAFRSGCAVFEQLVAGDTKDTAAKINYIVCMLNWAGFRMDREEFQFKGSAVLHLLEKSERAIREISADANATDGAKQRVEAMRDFLLGMQRKVEEMDMGLMGHLMNRAEMLQENIEVLRASAEQKEERIARIEKKLKKK